MKHLKLLFPVPFYCGPCMCDICLIFERNTHDPPDQQRNLMGFVVILPIDFIVFAMKLLFNPGFRCACGICLLFARNARDPPDQQRNLMVFVVILPLDHIVFAMKLIFSLGFRCICDIYCLHATPATRPTSS